MKNKINLVFSFFVFFVFFSCLPLSESSLAEYIPAEGMYTKEVCDSSEKVSRISNMKIGSMQMILYTKDYCQSNNSKTSSFSLNGDDRKPVMILMKNGDNDPQVQNAGQEIQPWLNQNFRVLNVPGDLSPELQQQIIEDDKRVHPGDYGDSSWVGVTSISHGSIDTAPHNTVKVDPTLRTSTSIKTTDYLRPVLSSIGDEAGNVTCLLFQCGSGQVVNDSDFNQIRTNPNNPDQNRVFQFSAKPGNVASISSTNINGPTAESDYTVPTVTAEKSFILSTQNANIQNGLTVEQMNQQFNQANLGRVTDFQMETMYVPTPGSTDRPLISHINTSPIFEQQGPIVVGPKDAYVFPPGIAPNNTIPPQATGSQEINGAINTINNSPLLIPGPVITVPDNPPAPPGLGNY